MPITKQKKPRKLRRLRPYQIGPFAYTLREEHPFLVVEMRLGKTIITIRRIKMYKPLDRDIGLRVLVIAPVSALGGWVHELALEHERDVAMIRGSREKRIALLQEGHKWNLLNYEGCPVVADEITDQDFINWDAIVLDETTKIKNVDAQRTRFFLHNFRDCPHRWALSGLPNPESDLEFWAQIAWLDGRAFEYSSFWGWRNDCFVNNRWGSGWQPRTGVDKLIQEEVGQRASVLRRRDVRSTEEKVYQRRYIEMPSRYRKTYDTLEQEYILEADGKEMDRTFYSMVQYQWCRRICGGFIKDELVWDGKWKELKYLMKNQLQGQPLVIWFAFNYELLAVAKRIEEMRLRVERIYGGVSKIKREQAKVRFQNGFSDVICCQERTKMHGVDFSRADTFVYYSNAESCEARAQSEDRGISMDKEYPILLIDLVVEDTVDEDASIEVRAKENRSQRSLEAALRSRMRRRVSHAI